MGASYHNAHAVRVRYAGPTNSRGSRWVASWEGWTGADRMVRKTFHYDHSAETGPDNFANRVAEAFVAWLNAGPGDMPWRADRVLDRVTVGGCGDDWFLLVETRHAEA